MQTEEKPQLQGFVLCSEQPVCDPLEVKRGFNVQWVDHRPVQLVRLLIFSIVAVAGFEAEGTAGSSSKTVAGAGFEGDEVDGVFTGAGFESTGVASGPPSFSKAFASWKDTPKIVTSQVVFTGSDCAIV
jgi:hypothetical protein